MQGVTLTNPERPRIFYDLNVQKKHHRTSKGFFFQKCWKKPGCGGKNTCGSIWNDLSTGAQHNNSNHSVPIPMAHVTCGLWRGEGFEDDEAIVLGRKSLPNATMQGALTCLGSSGGPGTLSVVGSLAKQATPQSFLFEIHNII